MCFYSGFPFLSLTAWRRHLSVVISDFNAGPFELFTTRFWPPLSLPFGFFQRTPVVEAPACSILSLWQAFFYNSQVHSQSLTLGFSSKGKVFFSVGIPDW